MAKTTRTNGFHKTQQYSMGNLKEITSEELQNLRSQEQLINATEDQFLSANNISKVVGGSHQDLGQVRQQSAKSRSRKSSQR